MDRKLRVLAICLHGFGQTAERFRRASELGGLEVALHHELPGVLDRVDVVFPQARMLNWSHRRPLRVLPRIYSAIGCVSTEVCMRYDSIHLFGFSDGAAAVHGLLNVPCADHVFPWRRTIHSATMYAGSHHAVETRPPGELVRHSTYVNLLVGDTDRTPYGPATSLAMFEEYRSLGYRVARTVVATPHKSGHTWNPFINDYLFKTTAAITGGVTYT